jgi:hypothetical protein
MALNHKAAGSATSVVRELVKFLDKNLVLSYLGRRESSMTPKQLAENLGQMNFRMKFKPLNRLGYKIWLVYSWFCEDEYLGYFIRDFITQELERKNLSLKNGETEFLPYLVHPRSAARALESEYSNRVSEIFGLLGTKDKKGKFLFPKIFVQYSFKRKYTGPRYSGYCRGHRTSTPAKKDEGLRLKLEHDISYFQKKRLYQLLFDTKVKVETALFISGFTDNLDPIPELFTRLKEIEDEIETMKIN